jgi:ATPase subunit of ABC transporter with duplicated ATPase domains
MLRQNHFEFDDFNVLRTVIYGHKRLYDLMVERDELYSKPEMTDEDGMRAAELEGEFAELNGWVAKSEAAELLVGLGIPESLHDKKMKELDGSEKVRVLLAQALFGNPDILLLDEPTNHLDLESITALNNGLINFTGTILFASHDHQFMQTIANRIMEITPKGLIDKVTTYDEYLEDPVIKEKRAVMYS